MAADRGVGSNPRSRVSTAGRWVGLGLGPAIVFGAHFFYGATLDAPALTMFALLSAVALVGLAAPAARRDLAHLRPTGPLFTLFALVIGVAALTLTSLTPGGPHPIWAWAGLSPSSTLNRSATLVEMIKLTGLAGVFVLGCLLGARGERARAVFGALLVLGGIYAFAGLTLFLSGLQVAVEPGRLSAGFYSANIAATQFGVLTVLAAAWAVRQWSRLGRETLTARVAALAPTLALVLLFVICLLLTASRAGIAATILAVALMLGWAAFDNRRARWPLMAVGGLVILTAVALFLQGNSLFADRFGALDTGVSARSVIVEAHWDAFLAAPLFGHGLGAYPQVNNQILTSQNFEALSYTVVLHNAYLQWLEEAGVAGAIPMFLVVAAILAVTALNAARRPRNRTLVIGLLAASLVVVLHAAVDVSLNTPSFAAFWSLLLGFGFALSQAPSRSRS